MIYAESTPPFTFGSLQAFEDVEETSRGGSVFGRSVGYFGEDWDLSVTRRV
jgi:hypothetical protein